MTPTPRHGVTSASISIAVAPVPRGPNGGQINPAGAELARYYGRLVSVCFLLDDSVPLLSRIASNYALHFAHICDVYHAQTKIPNIQVIKSVNTIFM